jgi:hypothetical protein
MASFAEGKIEAYVGPPELGAADDLEQVIVEFIDTMTWRGCRCGCCRPRPHPELEIVKQLLKGIRECYSVPVHDRAAVRGGPGVDGPFVD